MQAHPERIYMLDWLGGGIRCQEKDKKPKKIQRPTSTASSHWSTSCITQNIHPHKLRLHTCHRCRQPSNPPATPSAKAQCPNRIQCVQVVHVLHVYTCFHLHRHANLCEGRIVGPSPYSHRCAAEIAGLLYHPQSTPPIMPVSSTHS